MSLQKIIDSAQSIEISRQALVSSTTSRSGRLITASRNWSKPWSFTVVPKPYWRYSELKPIMEAILLRDRFAEHTIRLGQTPGAEWMVKFDGAALGGASGVTVNGAGTGGTTMVLNLGTANAGFSTGTVMFRAGDIIQPAGQRYPYVVAEDALQPVSHTATDTITLTINRGILPTTLNINNATILQGKDCSWIVKITTLPKMQYLPGELAQFTGEFEILESVI